jgi:predicted RNA-binding Zn-ribbon protein involved in translation (DUF1610 family)
MVGANVSNGPSYRCTTCGAAVKGRSLARISHCPCCGHGEWDTVIGRVPSMIRVHIVSPGDQRLHRGQIRQGARAAWAAMLAVFARYW